MTSQHPTSDAELLRWSAAIFGLIVAVTVLVFGIVERDVIAFAGAIGIIWAGWLAARWLVEIDAPYLDAAIRLVAPAALIVAVFAAVGAWRAGAAVLAAYVVAQAAYILLIRPYVDRERARPRRAWWQ